MPVWIYRILKFMTNFIPFRAWRKSCIEKLKSRMFVYPYWRDYQTLYTKIACLEKYKGEIKSLILGSSHGNYGYVPFSGQEYNLCCASQDLYYSYKLYEKYAKQLPKLQNIVLFYSVFSSGFCLEKTSVKYLCLLYYYILGILPQSQSEKENIEQEIEKWAEALQKLEKQMKLPQNYYGSNLDIKGKAVGRLGEQESLDRANKALKHNRRGDLELRFLKQMIEAMQQNKHCLYIVLSPAHKDYKSILPTGKELFKSLKKLLALYGDKIKLINLYDNFDLPDDCWWDYDHVNLKGAALVTKEIKKQIQIKNNGR